MNKDRLFNPSQMVLQQAIDAIRSMDPALRVAQTSDEVFTVLYDHLKTFYLSLGHPTLSLKRLVGPPLSKDFNEMLSAILLDLNIIFEEYRSIGKYVEGGFNLTLSEHIRIKESIKEINNILSDYRIYAKREYSTDFVVGDSFTDFTKTDKTLTTADILTDVGIVILKRKDLVDRLPGSIISVLDSSNGLYGNYPEAYIDGNSQEETKYDTAPKIYSEDNTKVKFFAESDAHGSLGTIIDSNSDSWFEYESILPVDNAPSGIGSLLPGTLKPGQSGLLSLTKGFGFQAKVTTHQIEVEAPPDELVLIEGGRSLGFADNSSVVGTGKSGIFNIMFFSPTTVPKKFVQKTEAVNVAGEPEGGILKLNLLFTMTEETDINYISISPYSPHFIKGYSFRVKDVKTSSDGVNFLSITRNIQNSFSSDQEDTPSTFRKSIAVGESTTDTNKLGNVFAFSFSGRKARYILFELEQERYYPTKFGHLYYIKHTSVKYGIAAVSQYQISGRPGSAENPNRSDISKTFEERIEGPLPETTVTKQYQRIGRHGTKAYERMTFTITQQTDINVSSGIEQFPAMRWLIGIRDITVRSSTYFSNSEFISETFPIIKPISKIALIVSESIPEELLAVGDHWIEYYFSIDGGSSWNRISPQNFGTLFVEGVVVPELWNINSNVPEGSRASNHGYLDNIENPTSIKFRAVLKGDPSNNFVTPILRDYRFKIISLEQENL